LSRGLCGSSFETLLLVQGRRWEYLWHKWSKRHVTINRSLWGSEFEDCWKTARRERDVTVSRLMTRICHLAQHPLRWWSTYDKTVCKHHFQEWAWSVTSSPTSLRSWIRVLPHVHKYHYRSFGHFALWGRTAVVSASTASYRAYEIRRYSKTMSTSLGWRAHNPSIETQNLRALDSLSQRAVSIVVERLWIW